MITLQRISRRLASTLTTVLLTLAFIFPLHLHPWPTFHNEFLFAAAVILAFSIHLDRATAFDIRFHTACATLLALPVVYTLWGRP